MDPSQTRDLLADGIGRRAFLSATAALAGAGALTACTGPSAAPAQPAARTPAPGPSIVPIAPLQPGGGPIDGDHYLQSTPEAVRWGYVPAIDATPVLQIGSGQTVTIDAVSHEGILEDQGRDPVAFFGRQGVAGSDVLGDAVAIARDYTRTTRDFDADGPHVITGPVFVEGARPGDVLKIETLSALPRVPYGVVSRPDGRGARSDPQGALQRLTGASRRSRASGMIGAWRAMCWAASWRVAAPTR